MFSDVLGKPVKIQGQDVIILPDIVGAVPVTEQHEYVEIAKASNTCASIQIREGDIEIVRQHYPRLPVYGLWQVLVASGVVSFSDKLQVVPVNEMDGYYVHADVGRIVYSGNYDAGFFAADTEFRLNHAKVLNPEISDLKLPKRPAMLAREILKGRRQIYRQLGLKNAIAIAVVAVLGFAADLVLQGYSEIEYNALAEKDKALESLNKKYSELSKHRLVKTPDQSVEVSRLAVVMHDLSKLKFEGAIQFNARQLKLTGASDENPALYYDFIQSDIKPDGEWDMTLNLR